MLMPNEYLGESFLHNGEVWNVLYCHSAEWHPEGVMYCMEINGKENDHYFAAPSFVKRKLEEQKESRTKRVYQDEVGYVED